MIIFFDLIFVGGGGIICGDVSALFASKSDLTRTCNLSLLNLPCFCKYLAVRTHSSSVLNVINQLLPISDLIAFGLLH